jgi:bifunctional UDP-N-acetylglucosamine pyrophosphorylase/glucosamine-1-phosphate N-acetyltransferase
VLADAVLEDNVLVKPHSMVISSHLSEAAQVGPFAHLRDGARLEENARVGNFVEVKKSVLGAGVKSMHLTYLGDARVGAGTNIGAGTITCNYDGVNKNSTTIGKRVFIGSDTALVAPVRVGDGAYVGAGSVITENVPADALGLARGRQVNMAGWAASRRRQIVAAAKAAKSRPRKKSKRQAPARRSKTRSKRAKYRKPSRRR